MGHSLNFSSLFFSINTFFAMKLQLLCLFAVALGVASASDCCNYSGVKCYNEGTMCVPPTSADDNECPAPCLLKGCDIGTLIKCGKTCPVCRTLCSCTFGSRMHHLFG